MKSLTFDEWKAAGFRVRKGEKATGRNHQGQATFTRDQVKSDEDFDRQNNLRIERE